MARFWRNQQNHNFFNQIFLRKNFQKMGQLKNSNSAFARMAKDQVNFIEDRGATLFS